jgi:hypothetical protein
MEDIIQKLIRTLVGALVFGLLYWVVTLLLAALASAAHFALPAFVGIVVLGLFVLAFILFVIRTWGFKF